MFGCCVASGGACVSRSRSIPCPFSHSLFLSARSSSKSAWFGLRLVLLRFGLDSIDSPIAPHADEPTGSPLLGPHRPAQFFFWGGHRVLAVGSMKSLRARQAVTVERAQRVLRLKKEHAKRQRAIDADNSRRDMRARSGGSGSRKDARSMILGCLHL